MYSSFALALLHLHHKYTMLCCYFFLRWRRIRARSRVPSFFLGGGPGSKRRASAQPATLRGAGAHVWAERFQLASDLLQAFTIVNLVALALFDLALPKVRVDLVSINDQLASLVVVLRAMVLWLKVTRWVPAVTAKAPMQSCRPDSFGAT